MQQPAFFKIGHERGAGLIGVESVLLHTGREIAVLIPGFVKQLDEANSAFDESPGQQAVAGEAWIFRSLDSVFVVQRDSWGLVT